MVSIWDAETGKIIDSHTIQSDDGCTSAQYYAAFGIRRSYGPTQMRWSPAGDRIAIGFERLGGKYSSRLWVFGV